MSKSALPGFTHVDHVGLTVPDLDKAVEFYTRVFGGTELYRMGPFDAAELPRTPDGRDWTEAHVNVPGARVFIAMLQLGPSLKLELFRYELPQDAKTTPPRNCDAGGHHIGFQVEDLDKATAYLRSQDLRVMAGPIVVPAGPAAGMRVNYFLDPWGNQLEVVEYPKR